MSLSYELALELKNAKFPFEWGDKASEVSLSKLIEACDKKFGALTQSKTNWLALSTSGISAIGAIPEEAVAKLWLALNPKKA